MLKVLEGPRFKIARASRGLKELGDELIAFGNQHPHEIVRYNDTDRREQVFFLRIYQTPPPILGVSTGEFIHNLRSALDHLANALPLKAGAIRPAKTQFPVFVRKEPDHADKSLPCFDRDAPRFIGDVTDAAMMVVQSVQPYNRPEAPQDHPLAVLHDFWNWDKHNAIPVVLAALAPITYTDIDAREGGSVYLASPGPVHDCQVLAAFGISDKPEAQVKGKIDIAIEVAFGRGGPAIGASFLPTLFDILNFVDQQVAAPLERVISEARGDHETPS
jgi:hypothetical protein